MAVCRACGAKIIWIKTRKGKNFPLNAMPVEFSVDKGSETVVEADGNIIKDVLIHGEDPLGTGYIPHWATCPYANQFRKRKDTKK